MTLPKPYYDRDGIVIYHGDCLDILKSLPDGSVDAVVTDPPYSSGGMVRGDRMMSTRQKYQSSDVITEFSTFSGDNRDQRGFAYWCVLWLSECRRIVRPGCMSCVFTDWRQLPTTTDMIQAGGWVWRGIVPWDKVVARPQPNRFRAQAEYIVWATNGPRGFDTDGAAYCDGVLRVRTPTTSERDHSTQKPAELIEMLLTVADSAGGGTIFDPFLGSGTTAVACLNTGRKCIGIEIEERYCEIAGRRCDEAFESQGLFRQQEACP